MMSLVAALVLSGFACQEEPLRFTPGEPTVKSWPLSGTVDAANGDELFIRARRIIRRWDANRKLFTETLSDNGILRAGVTVANKRFEGSLRHGIAGRYGATLADDAKVLYSEKLALGALEAMFTSTPEDVKSMIEATEKALEFLDELERILARQADNGEKHREDYLKRVNQWARRADEALERCDLSASATLLREIYFHIRNAQVWEEKDLPQPGKNDPPRLKKKVFMDMDLTIEAIRKMIASFPQIVSWEIKVSTTLILERLMAQSGEHEKKKEAARSAARAASKLAAGAPVPDKDVVGLLDKASDRSSDPAETRDDLRRTGISLVVQ